VQLSHCTDTSPARWLVDSGLPWHQLVTFGPAGFEAYARVRFLPDPAYPGQSENDADSGDRPLWIVSIRRALTLLAAFTDTPDECYFCFWEGMPMPILTPAVLQGPMVSVPNRRYALFTGRLADGIARHPREATHGADWPAFVWPADRRWCLTSDVDPHWAGIGAERAALDTLLADSELDAVEARPDEPPPAYR
jgi:hypothetical protein